MTDKNSVARAWATGFPVGHKLDDITYHANCGLFLLDDQAKILYLNKLAEEWFGSLDTVRGSYCWELFGLSDPEKDCSALKAIKGAKTVTSESFTRVINGENRFFYVVASPIADQTGQIKHVSEVVVDITARKSVELELEKAHAELKQINEELERRVQARTSELEDALSLLQTTLESTTDGILVVNQEGRISSFNKRFLKMWDIPQELMDQGDDQAAISFVMNQLVRPEKFVEKIQELYSNPKATSFDTIEFKDGKIFERYSRPQKLGKTFVGRVWSFRDVTERELAARELETRVMERTADLEVAMETLQDEVAERRFAEEALLDEKRRLELVTRHANCGLFLLDHDARITYGNDLVEEWFGPMRELKGQFCWKVFGLKDPEKECAGLEVLRTGKTVKGESFTRIIDGRQKWFYVVATPVRDTNGVIRQITEVVLDISERKIADNNLKEAYDDLEHKVRERTAEVTQANHSLRDEIIERKRAEQALREEEERFRAISESAQDGIIMLDNHERVSYWNASAEKIFGYAADEVFGKEIHTLIMPPQFQEQHAKGFEKFRKSGKGPAIGRTMELSAIRKDGSEFPIELSLSAAKIRGTWQAIGMVRDISQRKTQEQVIARSLEDVRKALAGTVQAMALTVETRDPYTAGHQQRVTGLACEIARKMGLSEEVVDGIYMAALIHDIGKIYVPAEILNKPGRLSRIEFDMIRTHSQVGYDILKTIEFSMPIAEIAYQHHERMDGTGYPLGLSGDDIMFESRILMVADVVEAMASHRPYRPALGIKMALAEITEHRGTRYDTTVVDACLKLFKSGYKLRSPD